MCPKEAPLLRHSQKEIIQERHSEVIVSSHDRRAILFIGNKGKRFLDFQSHHIYHQLSHRCITYSEVSYLALPCPSIGILFWPILFFILTVLALMPSHFLLDDNSSPK